MLSEERHQAIVETLRRQGTVTVAALSADLDVSEATVRRDLELLDEVDKRSAVDPTVAGMYDDMVGKPMRRTHRHITRLREAGVAHPLVEDEYAAHLMRTVNIDAAGEIRKHPHLRSFHIDQATRVYLAMIGYTGDMSSLSMSRTDPPRAEDSPADDAETADDAADTDDAEVVAG